MKKREHSKPVLKKKIRGNKTNFENDPKTSKIMQQSNVVRTNRDSNSNGIRSSPTPERNSLSEDSDSSTI